MRAELRIQGIWLWLLSKADRAGKVVVEKIEDGYHAVVLATEPYAAIDPLGELAEYRALEATIPHLSRTRAVYLNAGSAYQLLEIQSPSAWAGEFAADIESGARHAVAVVDPEAFRARVAKEFEAVGWQVEQAEQDLRVSDGRFTQPVNLLRAIVQMVFARSSMAGASQAARKEIAKQFALDGELFGRFQLRFQEFDPAVFDHYFSASPGASYMTMGWDYWQVVGKTPAEAERIFEQAMEEFETFLKTPPAEALLGSSAGGCERNRVGN